MDNLKSNEFSNPPKMNPILDDEFDINFKPLSKGLGFSHQEKSEPTQKVKTQSVPTTMRHEMNLEESFSHDIHRFYSQAKLTDKNNENKKSEFWVYASTTQRVKAFIFDIGLVVSFSSIVYLIFRRFIGIESYMTLFDTSLLFSCVFLINFYLYFVFWERVNQTTVGKNIFGIILKNSKNLSPNLGDLFLRNFYFLLGILSFGILVKENTHERLSKTWIKRLKVE